MAQEYDLESLRDEKRAFWAFGNAPTQEVFGLGEALVGRYLKVLTLLSDRVLAAASFYFESDLTKRITSKLRPLFRSGDIVYFIDETIETFTEHGLRKMEKSPRGLACYQDAAVVRTRAVELETLGHLLRRPSSSLSGQIFELWVEDVYSTARGTIGALLRSVLPDENSRKRMESVLIDIGIARGEQDFVWDYIRPRLWNADVPGNIISVCRRRLAQMYGIATARLVGVPLDSQSAGVGADEIGYHSRYDPSLFIGCMDALHAASAIFALSPTELLLLKRSEEFTYFRWFYFSLIEAVGMTQTEVQTWAPVYRQAANRFAKSGCTAEEFLAAFRSLCITLNVDSARYSRPIDVLCKSYDLLHRCTIEDFLTRIEVVRRRPGLESTPGFFNGQTVRILLLAANPADTRRLRLDEEFRAIDDSLRRTQWRDLFTLEKQLAVRVSDLQDFLLRYQPEILHFSGHGTATKEIILEDKAGIRAPVSTRALKNLLTVAGKTVRCVVLNACFSDRQAAAIIECVDCVIGMTRSIGDKAAISFAEGFYRGLGYGKSISESFGLGCNQLELDGFPEGSTPKLRTRKGVDASKIVLCKSTR